MESTGARVLVVQIFLCSSGRGVSGRGWRAFVLCNVHLLALHKRAFVLCNGRYVWVRVAPPAALAIARPPPPCTSLRSGGGGEPCITLGFCDSRSGEKVDVVHRSPRSSLTLVAAPTVVGAIIQAHLFSCGLRSRTTLVLDGESGAYKRAWMSPPRPFGGQQDRHCSFATATCHQRDDGLHQAAAGGLAGGFFVNQERHARCTTLTSSYATAIRGATHSQIFVA